MDANHIRLIHRRPLEATGLDEMTGAGAHCIAVDTLGSDLFASTTFQGLVDPEHQGAISSVQIPNEQTQQYPTQAQRRPDGTIEDVMILCEVGIVTQSRRSQRRCHGPLAGRENRTDQQELGLCPGSCLKHHREWLEYGYNGFRQREHVRPFVMVWSSLLCLWSFDYLLYKV